MSMIMCGFNNGYLSVTIPSANLFGSCFCFQDNEELMLILKIVNMVFAVLFTIEMLLKWVAFGLWRYFTSAWTCLDFVIVCVSSTKFSKATKNLPSSNSLP